MPDTNASWSIPSSGDWNTGTLWSTGAVPDSSTADATIDVAGTYTVTIAGGETDTVDSAILDNATATLEIQGTLDLAGTIDQLVLTNGTADIGSGVLAGGTIIQGSGGTLAIQGGTLDGVNFDGGTLAPGGSVYVEDGLSLHGTDGVSDGIFDLGQNDNLFVVDTETIDHATLLMRGNDAIFPSATLTIGSALTLDVQGSNNQFFDYGGGDIVNYGTIEVAPNGVLVDRLKSFTNAGSISLDAGTAASVGGYFIEESGTFDNSAGTIAIANGATFDLATSVGLAALGAIAASGTGELEISAQLQAGSVNLGGNTLTLGTEHAAVSGLLDVEYGGTLADGTIIQGNRGTLAIHSGTLDGVTFDGGTLAPGGSVYVEDGLSLHGTDGVSDGIFDLGQNDNLFVVDTETIDHATLLMRGNDAIFPSATLTFGSALTLDVQGSNNQFFDYGGGDIVNYGTIDVAPNGILVDRLNSFTNAGMITIESGATFIEEAATFENAATVVVGPGNTLTIAGTFHNDGTIIVDPSTLIVSGALSTDPGDAGQSPSARAAPPPSIPPSIPGRRSISAVIPGLWYCSMPAGSPARSMASRRPT